MDAIPPSEPENANGMTPLEELKVRLQGAKITTAGGKPPRRFFPKGSLDDLLNAARLTLLLQDPLFDIPWHKQEGTADIIIAECPKVFGILLELNLERKVVSFIENDLLDSALPLGEDDLEQIIPEATANFFKLQWEYLAYYFRRGQYHRKIDEPLILPYIEEQEIGGGGFSRVYKSFIHTAHQNLVQDINGKGLCVIRKEIRVTNRTLQYTRNEEAELLFLLGSLRHRNIIELLLSYTQAGVTNLLFAPADLDLHQFLLLKSRAAGFDEDTTIFRAVHGLSSGLSYLHCFRPRPRNSKSAPTNIMHGYHHDIKPRNILVRSTDFILADFGLSRLKNEKDDSKTIWKDTTFEYGAPECRDPESYLPGTVGRALDIWSLGCNLMEILSYIQAGCQEVQSFRDQRVMKHAYGTVRCFHDGESLSPNVIRYLDGIQQQTSPAFIRNFLLLIRNMTAQSPDNRPKASEVEEKLAVIATQAALDCLLQKIDRHIGNPRSTPDSHIFRTRLNLEKNRLLAWAEVLGLTPNLDQSRLGSEDITALFPGLIETLQSAIDQFHIDQHFDALQDDHDFTISILQNTNDRLCNPCSDNIKASVDSTFAILSTRTSEPQTLQGIASATQGDIPQYADLGAIAAMKYMSILYSSESSSFAPDSRIEPSLISADDAATDLGARPELYWYSYGYRSADKKRVIVEWKGYGVNWKKDIDTEEFARIGESMFRRIQELVAMLRYKPKPPDFRVLDCVGAFHDAKRQEFGIVYDLPTQTDVAIRLSKLLRRKKSQEIYPNPGQKLALAKALASSIHWFHVAGWVHKDFNSYNILFFGDPSESWKNLDLGSPYIVAFNHSRKDGADEYTEGPEQGNEHGEHRHPEYRAGLSTFKRYYDYYSLGLVLLEVGTWNSLSNIYDRYPTHSPEALRQEYLKICDKQLLLAMGPIYHRITKLCLQSDIMFKGEGADTHLEFQKHVVDELRRCVF